MSSCEMSHPCDVCVTYGASYLNHDVSHHHPCDVSCGPSSRLSHDVFSSHAMKLDAFFFDLTTKMKKKGNVCGAFSFCLLKRMGKNEMTRVVSCAYSFFFHYHLRNASCGAVCCFGDACHSPFYYDSRNHHYHEW